MAEASKSLGSVQFGPFELLLDTQELRKYGLPVKLSGQAIQVLIVLATRPGQLVTREELQRKLWPTDSYGDFEHGLNAAVNKLREKLGDSATTPTYVETLPGRGYRFIGTVGTKRAWAEVSEQPVEGTAAEAARPKSKRRLWAVTALVVLAIAAVAAYWLLRPRTPVVTAIHQLTHTGLRKSQGTYFPLSDGIRVYFSEFKDGKWHVAQVSTKGGEVSHLDLPSIDAPFISGISEGGSELLIANAFTDAETTFWLVPLPEGPARRIPGTYAGMSFLPRGNQLAYLHSSDLLHLFASDLDGGHSRSLLTFPRDIKTNPASSPDGTRLRYGTGDGKMWESGLDGTQQHNILSGFHEPFCCLNWPPDGKLFLLASPVERVYNLWAVSESGWSGIFPPSRPTQLTFGPTSFQFATASTDGKQILAIGQTLRGELSLYDAQSRLFGKYLNGISAGFTDFSRDGQWIAYVSHPEGTLWRSHIDGSERLQLTFPPMGPIINPKWSPDGRSIAFTEWSYPRKDYLVPADGGAPLLVLSGEFQPADLTWSPDGKFIAYGGTSAALMPAVRTEIRLLDLDTKESKTIPGSQGMYSPRWSPDGRHIVAESEDQTRIFLYAFEDTRWKQLPLPALPKSSFIGCPSWSHDSRYVFFLSSEGNIYRLPIFGGQAELAANAGGISLRAPALEMMRWFGLTPDDRVLVMIDRGYQEIYALDLDYR